MKILGIDYGRKKIGISYAETSLSEPLKVITYEENEVLVEKIKNIIQEKGIGQIVVGVSEGEMGIESKDFGKLLEKHINIPVLFFDETLSTQYAQQLSREAGIGRKKRKEMEDAYASAVMLQNYLDQQEG